MITVFQSIIITIVPVVMVIYFSWAAYKLETISKNKK